MRDGLNREQIVKIAAQNGGFYVNKYDSKSTNLRKKCRRLAKEGILILDGIYKGQITYRVSEGQNELSIRNL